MDKKEVRRTAQCIQTLLKAEGASISIKKVVEVINGEDLNNILGLKEKVKKVISNPNITSFDRRKVLNLL